MTKIMAYGAKPAKHAILVRIGAEGGLPSPSSSPGALKGQPLLAQGNALGIMAISNAPCKGKSFVYCPVFEGFCPYRATGLRPYLPRVLPWARSFCPFRAYGAKLAKYASALSLRNDDNQGVWGKTCKIRFCHSHSAMMKIMVYGAKLAKYASAILIRQ